MKMDIIQKNFGAEPYIGSEEGIREWLVNRIATMLDHETDLLWSTLYRMDVEEHKIKAVIQNQHLIPIAEGLTILVLERQKQRNDIRRQYGSADQGFSWGDEDE